MGTAQTITLGDPNDGIRLEHLKSRGVVRAAHLSQHARPAQLGEVHIRDFCEQLGIDAPNSRTSSQYLVIAGDNSGIRVIAPYGNEGEARAEFGEIRRRHPGSTAWGEVVVLASGGQVRRLGWFGDQAGRIGEAKRAQTVPLTLRERRRRPHRWYWSWSSAMGRRP
jgi:hypothetical protein